MSCGTPRRPACTAEAPASRRWPTCSAISPSTRRRSIPRSTCRPWPRSPCPGRRSSHERTDPDGPASPRSISTTGGGSATSSASRARCSWSSPATPIASGHRGPLTTELAVRWARLPAEASPLYQARRLEVVRCFARHRAIFDPATEIPPEGLLGSAHRRTDPPHLLGGRIGGPAGRGPATPIADRPATPDLRDADRPAQLHGLADLRGA